jgi:hypothetical protein
MAKDLGWFKFIISEYMAGDIIFCSDAAQGVFIRLCCVYWARECNLTMKQAARHFEGKETLIQELISDGVVKEKEGQIHINFLDEQKAKWEELSPIKSAAGKQGGRGNKSTDKTNGKQTESKPKADQESITKANGKQPLKQNKAIERRIRKDEDFSPERGNKSESLYVPNDQNHTLGHDGPATGLVKNEDAMKKRGYFLDSISDYKWPASVTDEIMKLWDELVPENINAFYLPFQRQFRTEENLKKRPDQNALIERLREIITAQNDESE